MFQLYRVFLISKFKSDLNLLVMLNFSSVNCASKILNPVGAPASTAHGRDRQTDGLRSVATERAYLEIVGVISSGYVVVAREKDAS